MPRNSRTDGRFGGTQSDGGMNNEDFQALARQGALDALKALAAIAVDPTAVAGDREHARSMVELRLEQASNDIPPDLRREIENVLHKQHR
jgi:hypothetical protein